MSGLIPAHAGKTRCSTTRGAIARAHPRSRGENSGVGSLREVDEGSSPLTRGKPRSTPLSQHAVGLIPAHAGKTSKCTGPRKTPRAHPRSRGENVSVHDRNPFLGGSSPLTRGKRTMTPIQPETVGLIPAHAGKTPSRGRAHGWLRAHPRSRGENDSRPRRSVIQVGSSPLTRGKPFLTCAFIAQVDQILESLELCASSEKYSSWGAYATDALQDQARSTGLAPLSSRDAS